ncbi:hypothetical protein HK405_002260, partial [Cladochytrium tenue]
MTTLYPAMSPPSEKPPPPADAPSASDIEAALRRILAEGDGQDDAVRCSKKIVDDIRSNLNGMAEKEATLNAKVAVTTKKIKAAES